jgi:hypothetical protein
MSRSGRELWLAFFACLFITGAYFFMVMMVGQIPAASGFFGHAIGVLGFVLMLMTETLYSLRKRSRSARWGKMAAWLNFHIFTGIVGPYLVLLHSSWKFNGLAGVVMLLTVVIVASGFIGRYIYTAMPRTVDGIEIEASQLEAMITVTEADLRRWQQAQPEAARMLAAYLPASRQAAPGSYAAIFERSWLNWSEHLRFWQARQRVPRQVRAQFRQLEQMVRRQQMLRRQVASMAVARSLLALWHAIHIPVGMVLFTAAFIHVVAAIYYATLLR